MSYCDDCGTKLSGSTCPNCDEELYIFTEQYEFLPDNLSKEFTDKVGEQKERVKYRVVKPVKKCPNCKKAWDGIECNHCGMDTGFDPYWD